VNDAGNRAIAPYRWRPGQSGNPAGLSGERRALYDAIEKRCVPRTLALLDQLLEQAMAGDVAAARLWLDQVRGPVKARQEDEIERAVEQRILELIARAKAAKLASE